MATLDRPGIIELLDRLGAESNDAVLEAARALHRQVSDSGLAWGHLLRAQSDAAFGGADQPNEATADVTADVAADDQPVTDSEPASPDMAEAARLVDRLLARKTISSTLREDLTELRGGIADGHFDAMDARYVRALAKRLGV